MITNGVAVGGFAHRYFFIYAYGTENNRTEGTGQKNA